MSDFKSICEDTIHASFFCSKLSTESTAEWENLCENINGTIQILSKDYIWHKDEMKLYLPITENVDGFPKHLKSTTCFGDNIDDEWFIVYVILEISKTYTDLVIQLTDNDGDFLLIEAANYLPSWANPESTENRVFLYSGNIHLIPPKLVELNSVLTVKDALELVVQVPQETNVSNDIEQAIWSRVSQYPQKIQENFHNAVAKLPLDIATLLSLNPSFISAIVDTYCNHDMFDAKSCNHMDYKEPILVKVKFTKCLYAMLMHSKLIKNTKYKVLENDKNSVLGLKLTCGFNMLMKRLKTDVYSTKEFVKFINNLKKNGYFKQNIQDSKEYNKLLENAKQYFLNMECPVTSYVATNILKVMDSNDFVNTKELLLHQVTRDLSEDKDDWLNIHPNQLNDLLNVRYGDQIKFKTNDLMTPQAITTKLTDFLKQTSDFEGIDTRESNETDSDCIEFNSDDFVNCLEKMMNLLSSDNKNQNIESDSDIEYGSDITEDEEDDLMEKELAAKLHSISCNTKDSKTVMSNLTQSIKEEGLTGPSSNILKTIGINKTDIFDSDDD